MGKLVIIEDFLTVNPYSRPGIPLKGVKKLIVHYVGNPKTTAKQNRNYFESLKSGKGTSASSHYIVGLEGEIIQCIPTTEVSYHAGASKAHPEKDEALEILGPKPNFQTIGIENCHPDITGQFLDTTIHSLVDLCAALCHQFKLDPKEDVWRHFDVTVKQCPLYYIKHEDAWVDLKNLIDAAFKETKEKAQKEPAL